jgi:hypothetical protein
MDRQAIRNQLPGLVKDHLPKNARKFNFQVYDGTPAENALGFYVDPKPFEGKVIAVTEVAIVVKLARTGFAVIDASLASQIPDAGTQVYVTPYFRRDFEGNRLDQPKEHQQIAANGERCTTRVITLGGNTLELPLPDIRCAFLSDMKGQLETLKAPDGFRTIANLLADAGASEFAIVDPADAQALVATPPEISCAVQTEKFRGRVALVYDAVGDWYRVELREGASVIYRVDDVDFTSVGATLERLIDDGRWRRIHIEPVQRHMIPRSANQPQ